MSTIAPIIETTLGYQYIGFTLSIACYGITTVQTYLYYRTYQDDSRPLKAFVFVLFLLDTLCSAFVTHALYVMLVANWGNVPALHFFPWTFAAENGLTVLITLLVQCFFATRVWDVSGRKWIPTAIIIITALVAFGSGLCLTSKLFMTNYSTAIQSSFFMITASLDQGFASLCDVIITGSLCYYLKSWRSSGTKSTVAVIDRLFSYIVARGILTAVIQFLLLITFVTVKRNEAWMLAHLVLSKVYINTMLATLNGRQALRGKLDNIVLVTTHNRAHTPGPRLSEGHLGNMEFSSNDEISISTGLQGFASTGKEPQESL
ncbi:uncharacterized protein B0H18DRAFT_1039824 [Fomitopsis serialis]|uniref:uncharacterized protein n=1 Tax=Fomitopsis serialis TaxID=139415 RepID=UPI002008D000|nr:uncharacterized protein B0H18DRAFT_1039824 [Neoantrodia serialis]KAH9915857.1 hypothetical protein B0H18DRAFT_1039824 [Neoantrodia serialis]